MTITPSRKFSDLLKDARHQKRMSQKELSRRSGICQTAICHYERSQREPRLASLLSLAEGLSMSIEDLLGRDRAMNTHCGRFMKLSRIFSILPIDDQDILLSLAVILRTRNAEQEGGDQ